MSHETQNTKHQIPQGGNEFNLLRIHQNYPSQIFSKQNGENQMKKWLNEHPYLLTSVIFLIIVLFGWRFLYWRWENFAFILLLYFIVTVGIRLDDISKKIGFISPPAVQGSDEKESIISQLNEIKLSLRSINATLKKVLEQNKKEDPFRDNPD
jgi:hypothetical protein